MLNVRQKKNTGIYKISLQILMILLLLFFIFAGKGVKADVELTQESVDVGSESTESESTGADANTQPNETISTEDDIVVDLEEDTVIDDPVQDVITETTTEIETKPELEVEPDNLEKQKLENSSKVMLKEGVNIIEDIPYVYDKDGNLVTSRWYTTSDGKKTYADEEGRTQLSSVRKLENINYAFNSEGYLAINDWVEVNDGNKAFGAPGTGKAYTNGAFTVSDGIRYVFGQDGTLAKGTWVYEQDFGWSYGKPNTGEAYKQGAFTLVDNIRYAFDNYGYRADGRWIYEPGYGYAYGKPSSGEVYKQGAFTLNDGIRYAFDPYGFRADGRWIYEPGYGYAYGKPSSGEVYKQGAFTLNDGIRYAFDPYGFRADGRWIYEPGYGYAYGNPSNGSVYKQGAFTLNDNVRYVFDKEGYRADGKWVLEPGYGWTFGDNSTGTVYRDRYVRLNNRSYYFNSLGFWHDNIYMTSQNWAKVKFIQNGNYLYAYDSNGNKLTQNLIVNGNVHYVNPVHGNIYNESEWKVYGNKEHYFFSDGTVAKPYQKIGNSYVNGTTGYRINALAKGIDVSHWQSKINWSQVVQDDIEFALIRVGHGDIIDSRYKENILEANKHGIKTGVYFYSMAINEDQARREAEQTLQLIQGFPINMPVVMDLEDDYILKNTRNSADRSRIVNAFLEVIKKAGYEPMIYANEYWLNNYVDLNVMNNYDLWVARWGSKMNLPGKIWQASSTGKIRGISTDVDIDFMFKDYSYLPTRHYRY